MNSYARQQAIRSKLLSRALLKREKEHKLIKLGLIISIVYSLLLTILTVI